MSDGCAIVGGRPVQAPDGMSVTTWLGRPDLLSVHTDTRQAPPTQLVIHRGAETLSCDPSRTKRILDKKRLSSLWTLTPDGRLWQHWDPADRCGRHATHHSGRSDSIDVQGPLGLAASPCRGQHVVELSVAIGRAKADAATLAATPEGQRAAVLARRRLPLRQWALTPAQADALAAFLRWWCPLRGIPLRACEGLRCYRVGGLGVADPATRVTGILAHAQVAGPGQRVDGLLELHTLRARSDTEIAWRPEAEFWGEGG